VDDLARHWETVEKERDQLSIALEFISETPGDDTYCLDEDWPAFPEQWEGHRNWTDEVQGGPVNPEGNRPIHIAWETYLDLLEHELGQLE